METGFRLWGKGGACGGGIRAKDSVSGTWTAAGTDSEAQWWRPRSLAIGDVPINGRLSSFIMPQDTPSPSANSATRSGWRAPTPPVSSLCLPGAELLSKERVPSGPGAEKNSQDLWARGSVSLTLWFHFSFNWRDRISRASELLECLTPAPSA